MSDEPRCHAGKEDTDSKLGLCFAALVLAGCGEHATGPAAEAAVTASGLGADRLGVLSRNLYVGADVDAVVAALVSSDPTDDLPALLTAVDTVQETHWRPGTSCW